MIQNVLAVARGTQTPLPVVFENRRCPPARFGIRFCGRIRSRLCRPAVSVVVVHRRDLGFEFAAGFVAVCVVVVHRRFGIRIVHHRICSFARGTQTPLPVVFENRRCPPARFGIRFCGRIRSRLCRPAVSVVVVHRRDLGFEFAAGFVAVCVVVVHRRFGIRIVHHRICCTFLFVHLKIGFICCSFDIVLAAFIDLKRTAPSRRRERRTSIGVKLSGQCLLLIKKIQSTYTNFVQDYVPESLDCAAEFEAPPSPDSNYIQALLGEDDLAKDPVVVPNHLRLTVLAIEDSDEALSSSWPRHALLNR
ncbi:hypothetical protein Nepgr_013827 [Nepenthes gracilis]|uniref:Uncharacterized protein n=1 Tax=Nepenthes gracilis TaxID=150966 RepID=A0AAD3XPR0_NEPGR|nr:hypothetical protein Nepgr_013827 [Nepenthes gracilis]